MSVGPLMTQTIDSSKVAYVAKPGGPVDTSPYMWAGYAIAAVIYAAYIVLLLRRMARLRARLRP